MTRFIAYGNLCGVGMQLPFDIQPLPSSRISDLDKYYYESKYLPSTIAADILAANDRSFEERLASSKMIVAVNEPTPTLLGVLVAGNRPADIVAGGYIQFLRLDGSELSSPIIDEQRIDGKLAEVVQGMMQNSRPTIEPESILFLGTSRPGSLTTRWSPWSNSCGTR